MKFYDESPPVNGNLDRTIKKFAWLPTDVKERETNKTLLIWLESYYITQFRSAAQYRYGWITLEEWIPAPSTKP